MLENIKLSFEEVNGDATTTTTIVINKEVRTLDEALDAIRNHHNGEPSKPVEALTPPTPPAPPTGEAPAPPAPPTAEASPTPPAPGAGASPVPPVGAPVPSAPSAPPTGTPDGGVDRQDLIDQINAKFETDPKYKDFMQIINVMKQATAPNEKTAINDFTDQEVQKLADLVL